MEIGWYRELLTFPKHVFLLHIDTINRLSRRRTTLELSALMKFFFKRRIRTTETKVECFRNSATDTR